MKSVMMAAILILGGWLVPAGAQEPCLKVKKISTEYDALQQGKQLLVMAQLNAHDCGVPVADFLKGRNQSGTNWEHLSLQTASEPGLTVSPERFDFHAAKKDGAREVYVTMRIKAEPDTALGVHEIPATLTYRAAHNGGDPANQELQFKIPVTVVDANKHVKYQSLSPQRGWSKWNLVWEIPLAIASLPIVLPLMMLGVFPEC